MHPTAEVALAGTPILAILVIMLGFRWSAARAGLIGLLATILVAWWGFGFGRDTYGEIGPFHATMGAVAEAVFTAATIAWILLAALGIHHLQVQTGAVDTVKRTLASLTQDPRIAGLLIFWFFALFVEGLAGFGTPVALTAPLLVSLGFRPVDAVALALIGHSVGVSFGAVGTPILPQIASTGLDGLALAQATGLYHALLGWIMLAMAMAMATGALKDGQDAKRPVWGWTALAAACFLLPYFVIARWIGPELPTLGGALFGGLGFIVFLRLAGPSDGPAAGVSAESAGRDAPSLVRATAPYWVLVSLILLTRLVAPVREVLRSFAWEWVLLDGFQGRIEFLYHPGTMLFLGFVLGSLAQGASWAQMRTAMAQALRQLGPVTVALIAMLSLSRIMIHAGMIDRLSAASARAAGDLWPLLSPMVGVLGTFVTGSATASNILFTDFQQIVARDLGLPVLAMIGAQGFGAAVGNIVCPHNIIAGGATVGLIGQEGKILGRTAVACGVYAGLGGLVAWWLSR
jgi:lactate permease